MAHNSHRSAHHNPHHSLSRYGLLKCHPKDRLPGDDQTNEHYEIHAIADTAEYRVAVNVLSQEQPSTLLYFAQENFQHPIIDRLANTDWGFQLVARQPDGLALDFVRGNLFDPKQMQLLPPSDPSHHDLNDLLDGYVQAAIADPDAVLYAFGAGWGPEENKPDQYFDFLPGQGIHDIHMNQGNSPHWQQDDGIWQDGGLLIYLAAQRKWIALFLAFQSQCFSTDDTTGHCA